MNALNSILSYVQRPISIKTLEGLGIKVFADEAKTQFRNVMLIFQDVAARWGQIAPEIQDGFVKAADDAGLFNEELANAIGTQEEWNDLQQRDLSQAAAGVYRRNYFIGMIERLANAQNVLNGMMDAAGYSQTENARTMETLEKKYTSLKTAAQQLSVAIGDAGLLDQLKGLVEGTTNAIEWFNGLDETLRNIIITFGEVTLAVKLFDAIMTMAGGKATMTMLAQMGAGAGWLKSLSKMVELGGAKGLLANIAKTGLTFFGGPAGIGALAASTAAVYGIHELMEARKEAQEATKAIGVLGTQYFDLQEKLQGLTEGTASYTAVQEKMSQIMTDIAQLNPELVSGFGEHAEVLSVNEGALKSIVTEYDKLIGKEKEQKDIQQTAAEDIAAINQEMNNAINAIQSENRLLPELISLYQKSIEEAKEYGTETEERAEAQKTLQEAEQGIINIIGEKAWAEVKASGDITQAIDGVISKRKEEIEQVKQNALEQKRQRQQQIEEEAKNIQKEIDLLMKRTIAARNYVDFTSSITIDPNTGLPTYGLGGSSRFSVNDYGEKKSVSQSVFGVSETDKKETNELLLELNKEYAQKMTALKNLQQEIVEMQTTGNDAGGSTGGSGTESGSGALETLTNKTQKYIDSILALSDTKAKVNAATEREISLAQARIDYLTRENASVEEQARATKEQNAIMDLYAKKQKGIEAEANLLREAIADLDNKQKSINQSTDEGKQAYDDLGQTIEQLKDQANQLGTEWWSLEMKMNGVTAAALQQEKAFQSAQNSLQHWARMGLLSTEQQIAALRNLSAYKELTAQEQWDIDEDLFQHYMTLLNEEQKKIEEAYKERIELIDEEADRKTKRKQEQIDALNEEGQLADREDAELQHNKNLEKLQEQLRYHQLRTGKEHQEAIAEIQEQIAEETRKWEKQQADWKRSDKIEELNQEILDIREKANKQKQEWQKVYKEMQADFSDYNKTIIAIAATYDEKWYKDGKKKAKEWFKGFKDGTPSGIDGDYILGLVEEATSSIPQVSASGEVISASVLAAINEVVYSKKKWQEGFNAQNEALMKWAEQNATQYYAKIPPEYANKLRGMNYDESLTWYNSLPRAHTGAEVMTYGAAVLKPGELVFPPDLSTPLKQLIDVLKSSGNTRMVMQSQGVSDLERIADRIERAIRSMPKQVGPITQNVYPSDDVDMEMAWRQLGRKVQAIVK